MLLDSFASVLVAAVTAESELFLTRSRHNLRPIDRNRTICTLAGLFNRCEIYADLRNGVFHAARCRTEDEDLVSHFQCAGFNQHLSYSELAEPVCDLSAIYLLASCSAALYVAPFSKSGSLIISVPESSVEHL